MFETIIALFIKRYVARYMDINTDQLSAELLYKQQIIIENLILNKTTLNEDIHTKFKLPIKIDSISIGKIQCSFVWSSLFFRSSSAAFIIKIENVRVVITKHENESSEEIFEEESSIQKRHQLDLIEQQLQKEFECFGEVKSSKWNVQRLFMSFFEKLQIEIIDVHISYESSTPDNIPYAIGLTCETIQISNEVSNETISRQVCRIIDPAFYIDINNPSTHNYILSPPNSMEIFLVHNHFLVSQQEFRYEFECSLNDLNMKCNIEQIRILVDILRFIRFSNLRRILISDPSRPRLKISKQSVKSWWRYATLSILRLQFNPKHSTSYFWFDRTLLLHRLHQLNTYKHLYRTYLDDKYFQCSNFTSEDEVIMNEIEMDFNIEYLLIIRRSIFQTRINEQLNQKREAERWYSTYANWITTKVIDLWGRTSSSEDSDTILNENDIKLQEQVNTFIAESLEDEDLLESCYGSLIFRFKFAISSIQIDLLSSNVDSLFKFYLKNLSLMTEFRLRYRSILISLRLEDLCVRDQGRMDEFSTIICSKEGSEQVPMFELSFEKRARSKAMKQPVYSITLRSCGFCVVCCPASVDRLCHFYMSAFGQSILSSSLFIYQSSQTKEFAIKHIISVLERILSKYKTKRKSMASPQLINIRRDRHRDMNKFHVYVDMGAPKIIIPLPSHGSFVADLGWVTLTNNESNVHRNLDTQNANETVTPLLFNDDDDEEFLTPDSSPSISDEPLETESIFYSVNLISTENQVEYASFSLSIRDIQIGYTTDTAEKFSKIIDKFDMYFLIQHPMNHIWPLTQVTGTLQKMDVYLDPQRIETLYSVINPWTSFVENMIVQQHYPSNALPALVFRLSELDVQLNGLYDICVQNIDLSLSKDLTFILQTLTISYSLQRYGKDYEFILKTDRISNINDYFIRVNIHLPTTSGTSEDYLLIDINADKLDFLFNPELFCTLINYSSDINLLFWCQAILARFGYRQNEQRCKIRSTFREFNILLTNIPYGKQRLEKVVETHIRNVSLNITLNPFTVCEIMVEAVQVFDRLNNQQQTDLIIDLCPPVITNGISQNTALHLLLTNTESNNQDLSIKIASISYFYSLNIIYGIQEIVDYITRNCPLFSKQELEIDKFMSLLNQLTHCSLVSSCRLTLSMDLDTAIFILPLVCNKNNVALQIGHIYIKSDQLSDYEINIDRIDLLSIDLEDQSRLEAKRKRICLDQYLSWPFLNNMSIHIDLKMIDRMITINSKFISSLRIFLGQYQIKFLQQILNFIIDRNTNTTIVQNMILSSKYVFRLQSVSDMIIVFQADRNYEQITICEGVLSQYRMLIEKKDTISKTIILQFDSLQFNDRLEDFDENLISLMSTSIIELNVGMTEKHIDIKFGDIDIKLMTSTWTMLSEIIRIFESEAFSPITTSDQIEIEENKKYITDSIRMSVNIDSVTCLFRDNIVSLMKIFLQRFSCQIQTYPKESVIKPMKNLIVNGQFGFMSIHDLSSVDQLYQERLCTMGTNALVFNFTTEDDHMTMSDDESSARPEFSLRMSTIQYIHTQRFLLDCINFFDRFQRNEDFYRRIRSVIIKPAFFKMTKRLDDILLNIEAKNLVCILPEQILKKSVLIFQLDSINLKNHFLFQNRSNTLTNRKSRLDFISIELKDIEFYPAFHCLLDTNTSALIRFSNFGFTRIHNELSPILRERFHVNMEMEHNLDKSINRTLPTYSMKMNLSSIDILLDLNQYRLIQNILAYNISEQSSNLFNSVANDINTDFTVTIEMDHVGLEIFDLLSIDHRYSLGYSALTNLHITFDQYSHENQVLHLICPSIKLINTRIANGDMIIPLPIPSNSTQLEIHLQRTQSVDQCILTLNSIRFLFVIDWLIELNDFLHLFSDEQIINPPSISTKQLEIKFNLNHFELVVVPTTKDPFANALVYSNTMVINYQEAMQHRPFECSMTDFTFFTCQIGNIDETIVSIIEPTDVSMNIYTSNEMFDDEEEGQICEMNIPMLNIRLSYSDVKMLYSMFELISKQIARAITRKPLLTFISTFLTSPIRDHRSLVNAFLNIQFIKYISNQICLCLIDDCRGVNIPLLNINLEQFELQTIENNPVHRSEQSEFKFDISYYNRFQSGFEPLIETCVLQMTLIRSASSTSLFMSSKDILNLNFTKAMYRLYDTVITNWLADYNSSKNDTGTISIKTTKTFRQVKQMNPYCFKNLVGVQIKFRTWNTIDQCFTTYEYIVDDNQTSSFNFLNDPSQSKDLTQQTKARSNSIVSPLFQSDRRLLISVDGWDCLQPISIESVGTFFRLAVPAGNTELYKPILVIIDVAMTDSSIRSITMRSSIEIRNQLLTSIDIRFKSNLNSLHEFCLEPNEIRSLPLQLCSILQQIQIRPADFALDYCDEPINWIEIENEARDDSSTRKNSSSEENISSRQSFLRTCSIDGKEAVYYVCLQSKQTRLFNYNNHTLSGYQLSILPPLTICNLLPVTLTIEMPSYLQKMELNAYKSHREHTLNTIQGLDILFGTDHYHMNKPLRLPAINDLQKTKYTHQRVIFYDNVQRELYVNITIECVMKHRLKVSVSVPYVLLNKSGIPLIFKDLNSKIEAAGQDAEDEIVLNKTPLLFAFESTSRNNTCVMRVGTGLHRHQDGRSQWSQKFSLEHGSSHRPLQVRAGHNIPDWIYSIGIDVRPGTGSLRKTNFIYLSARYMISNQCSYNLLIAQRHIAQTILSTDDDHNCLHVSKHATIAYHWPRTDLEQLLCVRIIDDRRIHWSSGFLIDCVNAFHINMRYDNGQCLILRVQVIERNGTYFIVFMDSNQMPAPFRISNRSDVPIQFYQTEIRDDFPYLRTIVQPQQSIDYAFDEPTLKPMITCSIGDGTKVTYDLLKLGPADNLHYQNFIYLGLQETFNEHNLMQLFFTSNTTDSLAGFSPHQMVIEYIDNRLLLVTRQENKRSQLWYMTTNGLLIHMGSSPSISWNKQKDTIDDIRNAFVLDIADLAGSNLNSLMTHFTQLTVRRYDPKRTFTQTWQFRDNGYLCMNTTQMCVQVFGELKERSDVVLGSIVKNGNLCPPVTMHIRPQQNYKGSGVLSVRIMADGPTNVLEIDHIKSNNLITTPTISSAPSTAYHLGFHFEAGVGISIIGSIGHESEELIYVLMNNIHMKYEDKDNEQSIEATITRMIISNQLLTTAKPCLFYATYTDDASVQFATRLQANWQKLDANFTLLHIIRSLHIDVNSITIQLDEILLWKLIDFFDIEVSSISSFLFNAVGIGSSSNSDRKIDLNVNDYETERILSLLTSTHATRIYFNKLYLSPIDLNLSICCNQSKRLLSPHLLSIKRRASFPLVTFENAQIHLKAYEQTHISNTYDVFLLSIMTHYINVCTRQSLKILGTIDFLGNPLALIQDVSDGVACLRNQHSVTGLVKSVAHGVANSTSKVTGSISHELGKLVSDSEHDNRRQVTTDHNRNATVGHVIRHGAAGVAAGFRDGVTSIFKQPLKGVAEDGMHGLVKGFVKGIVGTVSKPTVGILDFTSDVATAIKDSARSPNTILHNPIRLTRCSSNILGLLQPYSTFDAHGHCLLYKMNKGNLIERYITRVILSTPQMTSSDRRVSITTSQSNKNTSNKRGDYVNAMITTQRVIIYRTDGDTDTFTFEIINSYNFDTSMTAVPIEDDHGCAYIQFLVDSKSSARSSNKLSSSQQSIHQCDRLEQASTLSRKIQRAQEIFQEQKMIYIVSDDETEDSSDDILDEPQTE